MTSSENLEDWSNFTLISVQGVNRYQSLIYFLTATAMKDNELIAGYFPGIVKRAYGEKGTAGVFITWSKDGLDWVTPSNVHETVAESGRRPSGAAS